MQHAPVDTSTACLVSEVGPSAGRCPRAQVMACSYDLARVESMEIPSGLPVGVAAFVGRGRERAMMADLVADARMVTLTGSGGCGKTRLAVEVVGDVASRFADGARWVDLQGVGEPGLVATAVASALDVSEHPGQALLDTLAQQLRDRHLLVVLDNCEHLVGACAGLASGLVAACPRVHVLATSRTPLAIEGEATFEVAGLPVPDPDASSADTVAVTDSARLFELRARQAVTDFRIGADNAAAVAEICRRLDGIPLAIELAAARVRVLAPDQIAAGLSDRFALLTGGMRGAPARQRTLEASLDWSWDLLDDVQRLALARLSVFAGSFELEAAEAVVGGDGSDRGDVLDLVGGLVDHSLVQVIRRRVSARYRLLETIRAYARQRLSELDDPDRVRDRHLSFHVALAARAQHGVHSAQPEPWVARLAHDLDDLRAAMNWAAETGDLPGLVGVTDPIVRFWLERGLSREVHQRLHDAASVPGASDEERVRGLNTAAALALATYDPASIHRSAMKAVAAARTVDVNGPLALALGHRALAGILTGLSTSEQVAADAEEAIQHAQRCPEASIRAHVLQFAGAALLHGHSIDAGYNLLRQSMEVCEANDLAFHLPAANGGAAAWLPWAGRLDRVRRHGRRAIELSRQLSRPGWEAVGLTALAACDVLQGDQPSARSRLVQAQTALRSQRIEGTHYGMWLRHWQFLSAHAAGEAQAARATAEEIVRIGRAGGSRLDEAIGEWLLGLGAQGQAHDSVAREHLEASRELSTGPRLPHTLGRSLLGLAELAAQDDDLDRAWELAHDSLAILDDYGDRVGAASALERVAGMALAHGDPARSLRLLAASQRFHDDAGIVRFPLQADRFDGDRRTARAALDAIDATECWDAGSQLSLADAVAYARRGRGERRRPQVGWASLTPAELNVVRLVALGHTNAEIGDRIFISVNTVKKHLTRVYAKVDVDGRPGLAAEVARRDL